MNTYIFTNNGTVSLSEFLTDFGNKADKIKVASAFLSENSLCNDWIKEKKEIDLLISLRPPTDYYFLKRIQSRTNISFLGNEFHSKFYLFYIENECIAGVIGSSNFTNGGLKNNIETNAIFFDSEILKDLEKQFSELWENSFSLQPSDLEKYKSIFDSFYHNRTIEEKEQNIFEKKLLQQRSKEIDAKLISKEAQQYVTFWRIVDEVKELVKDISEINYPQIPVYLAIDHFWHWIKTVWIKTNPILPEKENRDEIIPQLFKEYCDWDKSTSNHTLEMAELSRNLFSVLLSKDHISELTYSEAKSIYRNMHSGGYRSVRFYADEKFVDTNSTEKIRKSLQYLLYSNDLVSLRIHNLCNNPIYKLNQLKSSGVQELLGWVNPNEYPLRNDKADYAMRILGYNF